MARSPTAHHVVSDRDHLSREAQPTAALRQVRMVGQSEPMLLVFEQIRRVAETDCTVVICGESGTGKELVAAALHGMSSRAAGPFVDVNTAAIPESLVESELFGHVKGAFTGASGDRIGRFEAANGGTMFIDEIGDFPLASQTKLLRALETRRITPVGASVDRSVDVRVVAATNCPLEEMVEEETFRCDLYYRLSVVTIFLPALRERRSDIPLLIDHYLTQLAAATNREIPELDGELYEFLLNHEWPGNVRQLRNCLESMLILCREPVLTMEDLPRRLFLQKPKRGQVQIPADVTLAQLERHAITQALHRFQDDRAQAGRALGISVRTLQRKLKEWRAQA